jgi:hypothetical protein
VDRVLPPANYRVVTDEVDLTFVAAFLMERDAAVALGEQLDGLCQQC